MTGFALWQKQVLAIVGLEWKKTLFAKRGLWVYALAFLPALLFGINAIRVMNYTANQDRVLAQSPNAGVVSGAIRTGMTIDASTKLLLDGKVPYTRFTRGRNREYIRYSDGSWCIAMDC